MVRPLDRDAGGDDLSVARQDLLATASARYGAKALNEALAAPAFVIAKRFAGLAPPPPPGAGPDWVPATPTALLIKRGQGWSTATATGWRDVGPAAAAALDHAIAEPRLWEEAAFIPPCPDYGASLLMLKIPGKAPSVRKSTCTSFADKVVSAALQA